MRHILAWCLLVLALGVGTTPAAYGQTKDAAGRTQVVGPVGNGGSPTGVGPLLIGGSDGSVRTVKTDSSGQIYVLFPSAQAVSQSGNWTVRIADVSGNGIASSTTTPAGTEQGLIVRNIPSGTQAVSGTVTITPSGTQAVSATQLPAALDGSGYLKVHEQGTATVSGTVTANAGSGSFNNASVASFGAAIGSNGTQAGGQVTSSPPTLTNGQFWPLYLSTAGRLITDNSQVTQPVSGTITSNIGTTNGLALDTTLTGGTGKFKVWDGTYQLSLDSAGRPTVNINGTVPVSGTVTITPSGTQTVSGTVTSNIGTTNGLALDATLTGGTQKSITRGGAKGATSAADVTSTANGADHQGLDVAVQGTVPVSGTFWQATQPVSGTVTANAGSGTMTVGQATGTNLHTVIDSGTTVVTQSTGSNLHVTSDTGSTTAVTQATGTNLHTVVDSGSITANIGTSGSLALDATLTGGSQKAIARGGAKGATTAADITSTANGADHQGLDVQLQNSSVAVTGTFWQATQPVSGSVTANIGTSGSLALDTTLSTMSGKLPSALGAQAVGSSLSVTPATSSSWPVTGTFWQSTQPVSIAATVGVQGAKTNNNAAPGATNVGTLPVVANASPPSWTEGNQVALSTDLSGNLRVGTHAVTGSGNFTVTQGTGTNLHVVADTGSTTAVTQATGTNLHAVIDSGSTTAVTQPTASNLNAQVVGAGASGATKAGNPVQVGGVYNSTQPTVTTGQTAEAQSTARGALIVAPGVDNTATNAWFTKNTDGTNTAAVKAGSTAAATADPALVVSMAGANSATKIGDGTNNAAIKAASTAAGATDPALVVAVSPNNTVNTDDAASAATAASVPASAMYTGANTRSDGAVTALTNGQLNGVSVDTQARVLVRDYHPNFWSANTGTATVTANTQVLAASGSGLSYYITDIMFSNAGASVQSISIISSTTAGNACATSPAQVYPPVALPANAGGMVVALKTPIKVTANSALCCKTSGSIAFTCQLQGFTAP